MKASPVFVALLSIGTILLSAVGCSSGNGATEPVSGKVTFKDGSPVAGGTIVFADVAENSSSIGYIQQDGTYTLGTFAETDGAPTGKYKVTVTGDSEYGKKSAVNARFGQQSSTPLEAEVKEGSNTLNFEVERGR